VISDQRDRLCLFQGGAIAIGVFFLSPRRRFSFHIHLLPPGALIPAYTVISLLIVVFAHILKVGFYWAVERRTFLTNDELKAAYVVIRHNVRTYESAGVVEVVKGRPYAESTLKKFENEQSSADRHEGWRYFLEKSTLKAGTDPTEATELRQAELESRESKATQDGSGTNGGGGMSR
jgi:cytoskeletal protein RodZ